MMLHFSANLSCLFTECELKERFAKASKNGFQAFEIHDPYVLSPDVIKEMMGEMKCDLVNFHASNLSPFGFASLPHSDEEFNVSLDFLKVYSTHLNIKKVHIMSGNKSSKYTEEDQTSALIQSLNDISGYLEYMDMTAVIEPMCAEVNSKYFLNNFDLAVNILKRVNHENVKLLLDIYHLHNITGDVKKYLDVYYPYAGHIQISQDPGRTEPFAPQGKIDYRYVFDFLQKKNHKDYIGLEYWPSGPTESTLGWMKDYTN